MMKLKANYLFLLSLAFLWIACQSTTENTNTETPTKPKTENNFTHTELTILDSLILQNPNNTKLLYQRAQYFYNNSLAPKALIDIVSAIRLDSAKADYYLFAAEVYLSLHQGNDAIQTLATGINKFPENEDLYTKIAEYSIFMNQNNAAMKYANDLLRINRNNADAYFIKGLLFKNTDKAKAISNFQTCVEQDPQYYDAYMQLGLLFSQQKDEMAIKYFNNALRIQENSREALYGKAYFYQQQKQYNTAKENYVQMIKNNRNDYQAFYNIGHCLIAQDSLEKANRHFEMALSFKPDYVDAIFMQGQIAERIGDKKNARIHYQNALNLLPNNKTIREALENVK